jgi:hypothetical protein
LELHDVNILKESLRSNHFTFFGIADAMSSLSFSAKESNQRKLPAAPASMKGSANFSGVVAEPDDAGFCG